MSLQLISVTMMNQLLSMIQAAFPLVVLVVQMAIVPAVVVRRARVLMALLPKGGEYSTM